MYRRLVELAPTPAALILRADEAREVMRPLGLRWRVDNILRVARDLVDRCGGAVPDSSLGLRSLPGVGDYVAGAVLCFAFGRRAVLVDTNTERIVGRIRGNPRVRRTQMRMDLHDLAGRAGPDRDFNFAPARPRRPGLPRGRAALPRVPHSSGLRNRLRSIRDRDRRAP